MPYHDELGLQPTGNKPYVWDKRLKQYKIIEAFSLKYPVGGGRPTKNSAGMAYTAARSGHNSKSDDVLALNVRGTLDSLTKWKGRNIAKAPCSSCGCKCRGKSVRKKS